MDLERITNILVERADELRGSQIDTSMFPKEAVPLMYALAAEKTLAKGNFEAAGYYLRLGQHWGRLLVLGTSFFHEQDEIRRNAGREFLEILVHHSTLPESVAIELADDILRKRPGSHFYALDALKAGNATKRIEELAYACFNKGNIKDGMQYFSQLGKKMSSSELERFLNIALEVNDASWFSINEILRFFKANAVNMPKEQAKALALKGPHYYLNKIINYMDEIKSPFTSPEFKEIADTFFKAGDYRIALEIYKKVGRIVSPEEYRMKGERILSLSQEIENKATSWSPGTLWKSVSEAYDFLSEHNPQKAKERLIAYADVLLETPNFVKNRSSIEQISIIYKVAGIKIPVEKALRAAQLALIEEKVTLAAEFYKGAGLPEVAKKIGMEILSKKQDVWVNNYHAKEIFQIAGDEEGKAIALFISANLRS